MALEGAFEPTLRLNVEAVVRIGTVSICIYDYVRTLRDEYVLWRDRSRQSRNTSAPSATLGVASSVLTTCLTNSLILFTLLRYISIAVLVCSNVGYFSHSFTAAACRRFYMSPIVLKPLQVTICQFIIGLRTYSISRRNPRLGILLIVFTVIICILEWFTNIWGRVMIQHNGSCTSANDPDKFLNWTFYLWAMLYDLVTLGIATYNLVQIGGIHLASMSDIVKAMLIDGLGYVVVLTVINVINLVLYRASDPDAQAAGATLGFAFTWIMGQNILLKTRQAGLRSRQGHPSSNPYSHQAGSENEGLPHFATIGGGAGRSGLTHTASARPIELAVQVTVDRRNDSRGVVPAASWEEEDVKNNGI